MSSVDIAVKVLKGLSVEEVTTLSTFLNLLSMYEVVDEYIIANKSKMHIDRVRFALSKLHEKGLIIRYNKGFSLLTAGVDALTLRILADNYILYGFGKLIGVGKESDVYDGITYNNERVALKFFRIGRTSFRDVRKRNFKDHSWILINIEAAKREYDNLTKLYLANVKVPKPIINVNHVIVMQFVEGVRLVSIELEEPYKVLSALLDEIRKAYKAGIISADLNEYNVLYDGKCIWIIDFPQAIDTSHPNLEMLLKRDIKNILNYFKKRYNIDYDLDSAIKYIVN